MLGQEDFYNSLVNFIPFELPEFFLKIFFYSFITPLSSTYAPLPYLFYPVILLFNSIETIFVFTLLLNVSINSIILIAAYNRFKKIKKENIFIACLVISIFGIGNLIYYGSNMPYSFIVSAVFLIVGISIDNNDNVSQDIWILVFLFLLNYQIIYLMPVFFTLKSITFIKSRKKLTKSIFISITTLAVVVVSSILFISLRGNATGTHSNVGVNWNSGINNEYVYDSNNKFINEIFDLYSYLPRSILYHFNENLFSFKLFSIFFWSFVIIVAFKDFYFKKFNSINVFFYTSLITLLALIFLGKSVYGPTRHTLFLIPLFCLFIFNNIWKYKVVVTLTLIIYSYIAFQNLNTIFERKNNFFVQIKSIHTIIENKQNHDILLFKCTYQPFIDNKFRESIKNKRVFFFCGNRLQKINSNFQLKDSLLIIDATGENKKTIAKKINNLIGEEFYSENNLKLSGKLIELNHNIEQKDYTQIPKKLGLNLWETENLPAF